MSGNPYAPPSAEVADIERQPSLERPRVATIGVGLLWASIAITVTQFGMEAFNSAGQSGGGMSTEFLMGGVVTLGIVASLALLTWYAGKGRNWARLIHVLWLVLSIALVVAATLVMRSLAAKLGGTGKEMPAFFGPWEAFDTVLVAAALILLYTPAANTWYRAVKASRKA